MSQAPPFDAPPYVEVEVRQAHGDYLEVLLEGRMRHYAMDVVPPADGGKVCSFAIGLLPPALKQIMVPGAKLGLHVASAAKKAFLGPTEAELVDDVRDQEPLICPVTLNIVRAHAHDPEETIRGYLKTAALLNGASGTERSKLTGAMLSYSTVDRILTVGYAWEGGAFEANGIIVHSEIPETVVAASVGKRVGSLVDHAALNDVDAIVVGIRVDAGTTRIEWRTDPLRVRDLPEAG